MFRNLLAFSCLTAFCVALSIGCAGAPPKPEITESSRQQQFQEYDEDDGEVADSEKGGRIRDELRPID